MIEPKPVVLEKLELDRPLHEFHDVFLRTNYTLGEIKNYEVLLVRGVGATRVYRWYSEYNFAVDARAAADDLRKTLKAARRLVGKK